MSKVSKIKSIEKTVMIDGWLIKQDAKGRYCLNDLHKASGVQINTDPNSGSLTTQRKSLLQS
ncbi:MAG: hypothetical protein CMK71_00885 [Pseudomonadaceae bacterium]|nr:hypothetical protein [Pseudomonadaceae bacterium]